jgi:glutathione S-transferase
MILFGQYDSPFVRRVAVTMQHYGMACERQPLSVFGDFAELRKTNPLGKVPALALAGGELIFDSSFILDYLDECVGPELALTPAYGPARREVLRVTAIALGLAEKSVELRGETVRRPLQVRHRPALDRLEAQIAGSLEWLEAEAGGEWLCGGAISQADVTTAVAITNLAAKLPELYDAGRFPELHALSERCETLPAFQAAPYGKY